MDDDDASPSLVHGRSPSQLPPAKRALVSRTHNQVACAQNLATWKRSPTAIFPPGPSSRPYKPPKDNPFRVGSKQIRPTVANGSSDLAIVPRPKFRSDWNLVHLKEKREKSVSSLPFKVDSKGKPLVTVALGSRQRMTSRS